MFKPHDRWKRKIINLVKWNGRLVKFGDNSSTKIFGKGTISIDEKSRTKDVLYVEGIKHNLLSVS